MSTTRGSPTPLQRHAVCATGAISETTMRAYLAGKPCKPLTLFRLRQAVAHLNLQAAFPGLFDEPQLVEARSKSQERP
jgi:hypothetical protein